MDKEFLDLSMLTLSDLEEIGHLQKALSLSFGEALKKWGDENPNKVKSLGLLKDNEIIAHDINEDGVKELKGGEALIKIINDALNKNLGKEDV